jgi:heme/copper-type cytochrome/quinol oxidase subunit 1
VHPSVYILISAIFGTIFHIICHEKGKKKAFGSVIIILSILAVGFIYFKI